jgi:uroporphyrinogen decarboxylase
MNINHEFCVEWANAQLKAGATAVIYFDPIASSSNIPKKLYLRTGYEITKRTIEKIKGPTITHTASSNIISIVDLLAKTKTQIIGVSGSDDLRVLKELCHKKLTILGNLNGLEMHHWSTQETEEKVKNIIRTAGPGGGFILSDHHGEIPYQVSDDVLLTISETVHKWGQYPLKWIEQ